MNPPFGRRNGHLPWLRKFLAHSDGVAIVRAYTSSAWFHQWAVKAQTMCFPRGKTKFIRPDGSIGRAPGHIGEHDRHDTRRLQQQRQGRAAIGQDGVRRDGTGGKGSSGLFEVYSRMLNHGYLAQTLRRPLPTKDGGTLRTLADAANYILALPEDRRRTHWDRTVHLLLDMADPSEISRQLELALFYDRQLNLKTPT